MILSTRLLARQHALSTCPTRLNLIPGKDTGSLVERIRSSLDLGIPEAPSVT